MLALFAKTTLLSIMIAVAVVYGLDIITVTLRVASHSLRKILAEHIDAAAGDNVKTEKDVMPSQVIG